MLKKYFTLILAFSLWSSIYAQNTDSTYTNNFPSEWVGEWTGDLVISTLAGEQQRVPMILRMLPLSDSSYTYSIVYGEDTEENTRPYILIADKEQTGYYKLDEANSIVLDNYLIGEKLYCRFGIMGSLLLSTLEQRGDQLIYEIISGSLEASNTTGQETVDGEDIPAVDNYHIKVQQRAVLSKS